MVCAPVRRDNPLAKARGLSLRTGAQTMLYLTCTTITSEDLAHNGVSHAKDWVSVDCGTILYIGDMMPALIPLTMKLLLLTSTA